MVMRKAAEVLSGRTLTSAWIETMQANACLPVSSVALSRVRGLKLFPLFLRCDRDHGKGVNLG